MGHGEHGAHRTNRFYFAIFAWLAIVTVIELFITVVDHDAFRAFTLIVLSVGKFALVVMFFMHMKGDRPVYAMVFVGPLFLALVIGVVSSASSRISKESFVFGLPPLKKPYLVLAAAMATALVVSACFTNDRPEKGEFSLGGDTEVIGQTPTPTAGFPPPATGLAGEDEGEHGDAEPDGGAQPPPGGGASPEGAQAFIAGGCGACHTIDGVAGASGQIGPNLSQVASRQAAGCPVSAPRSTSANRSRSPLPSSLTASPP